MAAGLGFKTFTTGEVLTAADVNGYLMQGILVFANAAARTSAITSPQEGQYSFLKDTNALEYYDGAAWVGAPVGDITSVTAGTGISGGGSSGDVTITNDMATTITAAGDIVVGTGSGTYDNLPIGTTGQVLTADTTVSPYKVKWASAASTPTFCGFFVYNTANQAISTGTATTINFDAESIDTDGFHSNTTNNTRITIPSGKAGKYLLSFGAQWAGFSAATNAELGFRVNGSFVMAPYHGGTNTKHMAFSVVRDLAVGDYVEMYVYQASGASVNIISTVAGQGAITYLTGYYLGA